MRDTGLPSWAIDFDSPGNHEFRSLYEGWESEERPNQKMCVTGGLATKDCTIAVRNSLHLRGEFFDRIETQFEVDESDLHDTEFDFNARLRNISSQLLGKLPGILKHDAYCLLAHAHRRGPKRPRHKCIPTRSGEQDVARVIKATRDWQRQPLAWPSVFDFWYFVYSTPKPKAISSTLSGIEFETVHRFSFFVTEAGFVGFGSSTVQVGDTVALYDGFEHALLLCPREGESTYTFCGLATVAGFAMVNWLRGPRICSCQ